MKYREAVTTAERAESAMLDMRTLAKILDRDGFAPSDPKQARIIDRLRTKGVWPRGTR